MQLQSQAIRDRPTITTYSQKRRGLANGWSNGILRGFRAIWASLSLNAAFEWLIKTKQRTNIVFRGHVYASVVRGIPFILEGGRKPGICGRTRRSRGLGSDSWVSRLKSTKTRFTRFTASTSYKMILRTKGVSLSMLRLWNEITCTLYCSVRQTMQVHPINEKCKVGTHLLCDEMRWGWVKLSI